MSRYSQPAAKKRQSEIDTALIQAAILGDADKIGKLLGQGASAKASDEGGFTALMWAARYDLGSAVSILLPESDIFQRDAEGRTALDIAKDGAGSQSLSAFYMESFLLALAEVEALSKAAQSSPKALGKKFRL